LTQTSKRISELDALRGIAALMVVLFHYTTRFETKFGGGFTIKPFDFPAGFYGVELFFIISGFVIFMTVDKVKSGADFVKRRFVRLFPTFWLCILVTYTLVYFMGPATLQTDWQALVLNFTMIPKVFGVKMVDGVYWSLGVELAFYTAMLVLIVTRLKTRIELISAVVIALLYAAALATRFSNWLYFGTLFVAGINFYKIWMGQGRPVHHFLLLSCLCFSFLSKENTLIFMTVVFYGLFYLLVYRKAGFLKISFLMFLGEISYAWYLLHQNLGHSLQLLLIHYKLTNYWLLLSLPLAFTILLAYLVTEYFEKPVVRLLTTRLQVWSHKNKVVSGV